MELIKTTFTDKKDIYRTTKNNAIAKLSDVSDNSPLDVMGYTLFKDENKDGKEVRILSIMLANGDVYATNSATAIENFNDIMDIFEDLPLTIYKGTGTSKNGRAYIYLYV